MFSPTQRRTMAKDTPLGADYQPGSYDVICTRGKTAYNHSGNHHFRQLIESQLEHYRSCLTKLDKSIAVIAIVGEIRQRSPEGGFVKFCKKKNCYVEVGDQKAREKVGHALRELMGHHTNSGDTSKGSKFVKTTKRTLSWKEPSECLPLLNLLTEELLTEELSHYDVDAEIEGLLMTSDDIEDLQSPNALEGSLADVFEL